MTRQHHDLSALTQEAIRIVADQLRCGDEEARRELEERSKLGQYRLHDYARLVVDGFIRFDRATPRAESFPRRNPAPTTTLGEA